MKYIHKKPKRLFIIFTVVVAIVCLISFSSAINRTITPVQEYISHFIHRFSQFTDLITRTNEIQLQNETLKKENSLLMNQNRELNQYKKENQRLLTILDLKRNNPQYNYETAFVIAGNVNNIFSRFKINKGTDEKIDLNDVVLSYDNNLIGYISYVDNNYSIVTSITDKDVNVSVYFPESDDYAVIESDALKQSVCYIKYIEYNGNIDIGDEVVTSGLGDIYPANIKVGTVTDIEIDNDIKKIIITPSADFSSIHEVNVLNDRK